MNLLSQLPVVSLLTALSLGFSATSFADAATEMRAKDFERKKAAFFESAPFYTEADLEEIFSQLRSWHVDQNRTVLVIPSDPLPIGLSAIREFLKGAFGMDFEKINAVGWDGQVFGSPAVLLDGLSELVDFTRVQGVDDEGKATLEKKKFPEHAENLIWKVLNGNHLPDKPTLWVIPAGPRLIPIYQLLASDQRGLRAQDFRTLVDHEVTPEAISQSFGQWFDIPHATSLMGHLVISPILSEENWKELSDVLLQFRLRQAFPGVELRVDQKLNQAAFDFGVLAQEGRARLQEWVGLLVRSVALALLSELEGQAVQIQVVQVLLKEEGALEVGFQLLAGQSEGQNALQVLSERVPLPKMRAGGKLILPSEDLLHAIAVSRATQAVLYARAFGVWPQSISVLSRPDPTASNALALTGYWIPSSRQMDGAFMGAPTFYPDALVTTDEILDFLAMQFAPQIIVDTLEGSQVLFGLAIQEKTTAMRNLEHLISEGLFHAGAVGLLPLRLGDQIQGSVLNARVSWAAEVAKKRARKRIVDDARLIEALTKLLIQEETIDFEAETLQEKIQTLLAEKGSLDLQSSIMQGPRMKSKCTDILTGASSALLDKLKDLSTKDNLGFPSLPE